jgi:hypothetical protein
MTFKKFDKGKAPIHLLPHRAMWDAAKVMDYGARKYGTNNWKKGTDWSRYYDAAMRHLMAWRMGEDRDEETGMSHLDHAVCCVLMLSELTKLSIGNDDRKYVVADERPHEALKEIFDRVANEKVIYKEDKRVPRFSSA